MNGKRNTLGSLACDQRGVIGIVFALVLPLLILVALFVTDVARYNAAQTRLIGAVDAAVLSAGCSANVGDLAAGAPDQDWTEEARRYFDANMPGGFLKIDTGEFDYAYSASSQSQGGDEPNLWTITMQVDGELPLMSAAYLTSGPFALHASSKILCPSPMELVLALDNSKYIDGTQLDHLRTATTGLMNVVLWPYDSSPDDAVGNVIGLVPFTDAVNVKGVVNAAGEQVSQKWVKAGSPASLNNYIENHWSGCIVEPPPPKDPASLTYPKWSPAQRLPDEALEPYAGFTPMLFTSSTWFVPNVESGGKAWTVVYDEEDTSNNPTFTEHNDRGLFAVAGVRLNPGGQPNQNENFLSQGIRVNLAQEPVSCLNAQALFLTKARGEMAGPSLDTTLADMQVDGGAAAPTGLLWAWRMLDPHWRGQDGWGSDTLPRDPGPDVRKIIIVASSGRNEAEVSKQGAPTSASFDLTYSYQICKKQTGHNALCPAGKKEDRWEPMQTVTEEITLNLPSDGAEHWQCPLMGLRTVDPEFMSSAGENVGGKGKPQPKVEYEYDYGCTKEKTSIGYTPADTNQNNWLDPTAISAYMADVCSNIKGANIQVYSINLGAGSSDEPGTRSVLKSCATSPAQYYPITDLNDLASDFGLIARNLTAPRLVY